MTFLVGWAVYSKYHFTTQIMSLNKGRWLTFVNVYSSYVVQYFVCLHVILSIPHEVTFPVKVLEKEGCFPGNMYTPRTFVFTGHCNPFPQPPYVSPPYYKKQFEREGCYKPESHL